MSMQDPQRNIARATDWRPRQWSKASGWDQCINLSPGVEVKLMCPEGKSQIVAKVIRCHPEQGYIELDYNGETYLYSREEFELHNDNNN